MSTIGVASPIGGVGEDPDAVARSRSLLGTTISRILPCAAAAPTSTDAASGTAKVTARRLPLACCEPHTRHTTASVAIFGSLSIDEQMAGIAFRIQDENNYYYIRSSALGGTFYFFKVVGGVRSAPIGAKVEIPKGVWHEMTIATRGNEIRASLNGRELILPLGDKSFLNGKIGFWTKSDSVSYFADTRVLYTTRLTLAQSLVNDALKKYPRLLGVKIFAAPDDPAAPRIIASVNPAEVGQPGTQVERDVLSSNRIFYGKEDDAVLVTMPLHDSNGDTVAAVKFVLKSFPGQTEKNAIGRVMPTVKLMEARVPSLKDLMQ